MPRAALRPDQKLRIAKALAEAGVASIDAGFPVCAASEIDAIRQIVRDVPGPSISALCRTLPGDIDKAWEALAEARPDKRSVSLFIGTSPSHREHKLGLSVAQMLNTVRTAVEYARQRFAIVALSAEDASRTEPDVLCAVYREAIDAGARVIGFPDTVGVLMPSGVRDAIRHVQDNVPNIGKALIAGHFHNDLGLATANTLSALQAGVPIAQCTVNGIGERAGNTALEEVVMALALHGPALGLQTTIKTEKLWPLCRLVAEVTGIPIPANKAVTGANMFATEAGIHQDGLLKHPDTYLPYRPEKVGAPGITLVLGKHSGRAAFTERLASLGIALGEGELDRVIALAKDAPKEAWQDEAGVLTSAVAAVRATAAA
jgi:2-isopropylmalate synthase